MKRSLILFYYFMSGGTYMEYVVIKSLDKTKLTKEIINYLIKCINIKSTVRIK